MNRLLDIILTHFDGSEGGTASAPVTTGTTDSTATGVTGTPDQAQPNNDIRKAEYAKLKEQYKDLYGEDVKGHIENRLKKYKPIEQQYNAMNTDVAELLELTGVKTLSEAKEAIKKQRDQQIESEAYDKGLDLDEYKKQLTDQRDAENYRKIQHREQFVQGQLQTWENQSKELANTYKDFNLRNVAADPAFVQKLQEGHTVKASYETVNAAKILSAVPEYEGFDFANWEPSSAFTSLLENGFEINNAFEATNLDWTKQAAAKTAEKRTVDTIKGGSRPKEMGTTTPQGGARNKGITNMTPQEAKRAMDDILSGRSKPSDYGM